MGNAGFISVALSPKPQTVQAMALQVVPLIKEYTLNHSRGPTIIHLLLLNEGLLEGLGI